MADWLFAVGNVGYIAASLPALVGEKRLPVPMCLGILAMDALYLAGYVMLGLPMAASLGAAHLIVWAVITKRAWRTKC